MSIEPTAEQKQAVFNVSDGAFVHVRSCAMLLAEREGALNAEAEALRSRCDALANRVAELEHQLKELDGALVLPASELSKLDDFRP